MSRLEKNILKKSKRRKIRIIFKILFILAMIINLTICVFIIDKSAKDMLGSDAYLLNSFIEDIKNYDYILARESLTFELLKRAGITKIGLAPDPAFTLSEMQLPLPEGFVEGNTIGINVSPLVEKRETKSMYAI